jgi:hypothetical protein
MSCTYTWYFSAHQKRVRCMEHSGGAHRWHEPMPEVPGGGRSSWVKFGHEDSPHLDGRWTAENTAWIHVDVRWHDPVTGVLREKTDGSQMIEVVLVEPGKILVQDEPSGTHRVIPLTHLEGVRNA